MGSRLEEFVGRERAIRRELRVVGGDLLDRVVLIGVECEEKS